MPWNRRRLYLDPPYSDSDGDFLSWKRTLFRFYAWFIVFWMTILFYGRLSEQFRASLSDVEYLDILISVPSLVGVLAFAYKKMILWPWFWRVYTPFIMGWDLWGSLWFIQTPQQCQDFFQGGWVFFLIQYILLLPMYFALFRLGFQK